MNGTAWTAEEDQSLIRLYPDTDIVWLCGYLNRSVSSVYGRAAYLNLKKDPLFLLIQNISLGVSLYESGKATRFKSGNTVWNKGLKGWKAPGCEKGWFKKGHLPANTKHDGKISLRFHKTGHRGDKKRGYYYIRLSKSNWKELHVYLWEQAHGPVPKEMNVVFKDGDSLNCVLENLELITRADHARRTQDRDEYIAMRIANSGTKGKGNYSREIYRAALQDKALLEAKRKQIQLNKLIKERQ